MILSRSELRELIQPVETGVSIYLPTHRARDEQDPIRLENLIRQAEQRFTERGLRAPVARDLLEPARRLLGDDFFWQHQSDGLAIFVSPGIFRYYRLPSPFPELAIAARRFYVKPLLPLLSNDGIFYILAISQKKVRLLQCSRDSYQQLTPETLPPSLAEALKFEDLDREFQFHYHTSGASPRELVTAHGEEVTEDRRNFLFRYFRQVDEGLHELLREEQSPLIVACVDYLRSIYRQANTYRYLLEKGIDGNPDESSAQDIHRKGWSLVQSHFERGQQEAEDLFCEAHAKGLATNDIKDAVLAAYDGRVSTLFAALGTQVWGKVNLEERAIDVHDSEQPGNEDLLDFAAAHTLITGGQTFVVDSTRVPGTPPVAAIFRY